MSENRPELYTTSLKTLGQQSKWICGICGKLVESIDDASRDHIIPISLGGHNGPSNIRLAHKICNTKRANRLVD